MIKHRAFARTAIIALMLGAALIASGKANADFVIPDDLIVQGSACVGLDCVDGEAFGFDTIRLKENNTRIKFDDTSTGAGFPNNDWQLTANDSASGGLNKFSIENTTVGTIPFTVVGPAPTNSLFVSSTGRVGLRTATPGLDLHISTSDTPAERLEQTAAGGFAAQTWDIGGNEANFFVRDVTGGSRLPFRIRPGAPTSSIDINAAGNVGMGTASPNNLGSGLTTLLLNVHKPGGAGQLALSGDGTADQTFVGEVTFGTTGASSANKMSAAVTSQLTGSGATNASGNLQLWTRSGTTLAQRVTIDTNGNVGIGTTLPAAGLHSVGTVRFAGVASCGSGIQSNASGDLSCIVSSRHFKNIAGELAPRVALANVMALRPQTGSYKETPDVPEHWLIAEDVAGVDPALIGLNEGKPHVVKTQNVVADLIVVVQQQQQRIDALERQLAARR
jgi:hypothetical protein